MNLDEAARLVRASVREVAPEADLNAISPDADLRQTLNLDSIDFLRLVELLSERSGLRIDEDDYPRLATLASAQLFLAGPPH